MERESDSEVFRDCVQKGKEWSLTRQPGVTQLVMRYKYVYTHNFRALLKPAGFGSPSISLPFIPRATWSPKNQNASPSSESRVSRDSLQWQILEKGVVKDEGPSVTRHYQLRWLFPSRVFVFWFPQVFPSKRSLFQIPSCLSLCASLTPCWGRNVRETPRETQPLFFSPRFPWYL